MCLMIDYPKYKLLTESSDFGYRLSVSAYRRTPHTANRTPRNLKEAWSRLRELVASIKPDENYQCDTCNLYAYCKWCPARGWLYKRSFTLCEPESLKKAELTSELLNR